MRPIAAFLDGSFTAVNRALLDDISPLCDNTWDKDPIKEGHGMKYPRYSWRQTTAEVQVRILVPLGTRANQLHVRLLPTHITVQVHGNKPIVDHELSYASVCLHFWVH